MRLSAVQEEARVRQAERAVADLEEAPAVVVRAARAASEAAAAAGPVTVQVPADAEDWEAALGAREETRGGLEMPARVAPEARPAPRTRPRVFRPVR